MASHWMTLGMLLVVGTATAQEAPVVETGARPPVMTLRDVTRQEAAQQNDEEAPPQRQVGVPGLSAPIPQPVAPPQAPEMDSPAAAESHVEPPTDTGTVASVIRDEDARQTPARRVDAPSARAPNRPFVKPAPARMTVDSGENHVVGIAFSHLNRIITPFVKPVVKTTSVATTSVEGSIVYVATNLSEPVGLFIHEEARPEFAISLTLVPAEIPPVSTSITVKGLDETGATRIAAKQSLATAFEQQHTYLEMLKVLFRDLALGKVPDGYGFEEVGGYHPDMPRCDIAGVHVVPLQLLTGASLRAFVGRAQNTSETVREIREGACEGRAVRAVAAWPRTQLQPGEAVEIYIALDVPGPDDQGPQRPSLLGAR